MLFPMHQGLAASFVFTGLNAFLLQYLQATATGTALNETALPAGLWAAIQANQKTIDLVEGVRVAIDNLDDNQREAVYLAAQDAHMVRQLLTDPTSAIPMVPESLHAGLKALGFHLYSRTSDLVGVIGACGESVQDHYIRYSANPPAGNGRVCGMCGTEYLAQWRANVAEGDQWRAPYDHLLAKDSYPLFALHPENLLPVCRTCMKRRSWQRTFCTTRQVSGANHLIRGTSAQSHGCQ